MTTAAAAAVVGVVGVVALVYVLPQIKPLNQVFNLGAVAVSVP